MPFTSISQLTVKDGTFNIENGEGAIINGHSFFYCEDIQKVLDQAKSDPNAKLSQLKIIPIKFEKNDGLGNHNMHDIIGLALQKTPPPDEEKERLLIDFWYDKVALAWPPYYRPGSTDTLKDNINSDFLEQPFSGHESYRSGMEIHKI